MNRLPEPPRQPHATQAGQPTPNIDHQAQLFLADIEDALAQATKPEQAAPTSYRDHTPVPAYGPTPPAPQPGTRRPPMSQKATDASVLMLSAGVASIPIGGMTSLVVYTLGHVDPTSLAIAATAPAALAIPILALSRLVKRAKETVEAAPPVIHQHYNGTVIHDERSITSTSRGIIANTRNQLPG